MPFKELIELKEKLGTKVKNETIVSKMDKNFNKNKSNNSFKRLNKNRPQEMSSKKPTKQLTKVFQIIKSLKKN